MTTIHTATQAAVIAHVHPSHMQRLCKLGKIDCVRHGNHYMIPDSALRTWMDGRKRVDGRKVVAKVWERVRTRVR